jgi:hypothetical protein
MRPSSSTSPPRTNNVRRLVILATLIAMGGCYQEEGQRCQSQDDCDQFLFCVFPATPTTQTGGICRSSTAVSFDASAYDAAFDATTD